ncbi:hypothetical protein IQ266_08480 [filamentous cyanobacterium LEGE 11480]|uniref:Uncharacterized protein n=1 Tax=Romeriopsis navalis LEGE 11480 TaxID=2777977 RepID=A0A928Z1W3_9CYAN|nr:hypothetical protein [Romeriopsis navalis]MBE9029761.1 hypothetical protein [Romeriopsis navalis LEGE 11480]
MLRQIASVSALILTAAPMIALNSTAALACRTDGPSNACAQFAARQRSPIASNGVDGLNATRITYRQGVFQARGHGNWVRVSRNGKIRARLQEIKRDKRFVQLRNKSTQGRLELDLYRNQGVYVKGRKIQRFQLISAKAQPTQKPTSTVVKGYTVKRVNHAGGFFASRRNGNWVEINRPNRARFNFKETHRDEWSVYLLDRSRNVRIQLDLHRKKVIYTARGKRFDLYNITTVR